ncbi:hypothetical protein FRC05_007058, partial [Tulasnella sp. 425]
MAQSSYASSSSRASPTPPLLGPAVSATTTPLSSPRKRKRAGNSASADRFIPSASSTAYDLLDPVANGGLGSAFTGPSTPSKSTKRTMAIGIDAQTGEEPDDFYLNLVDWSSNNVVGLASCAYLWLANTSKVIKLCDLQGDNISGVVWERNGATLAVGTHQGKIHIYDTEAVRAVRTYENHSSRVGALAWSLSRLLALAGLSWVWRILVLGQTGPAQ